MKALFALLFVCLIVGAGLRTASGQELSSPDSHAGVSLTLVPPLGFGADIAVPVGEKVNIRGGFNVFSFSHDFDNDGITLAAQLKLRSVSTHLDWFPFGGQFHLSPGVMLYNGNKMSANALVPIGKTFELGDESLISSPSNPVVGTAAVSFDKKVAPSVRVGWGNIVPRDDRRWSIPVELGVVFSRAPTAGIQPEGQRMRERRY